MYINAKNNFREGWIMLLRPFDFEDMVTLPKLTLVYAYMEQPIVVNELSEKGVEVIERISNPRAMCSLSSHYKKQITESDFEYHERINEIIRIEMEKRENFNIIHKGNILQTSIGGQLCRFYPDEYSVVDEELLNQAIEGEEFLMVANSTTLFNIKEFKDRVFYMKQRGINEKKAMQFASYGLKDNIYYIPHPETQKIYCRSNEVRNRKEFEEYINAVYGDFESFAETC